jgi:hypothetical protein
MLRIAILTLLFVAAWSSFGQKPPETMKKMVDTAEPPKISLELQKEAFKAQSAYLQAESALEQTAEFKQMTAKREAFVTASQKLSAICGDKFMLQLDKTGDPVCVVKPEPPKPAPTEKK